MAAAAEGGGRCGGGGGGGASGDGAPRPSRGADPGRGGILRPPLPPDGADGRFVALAASALDDDDIEVRGEAFGRLVISRADIAEHVERLLGSPSRNVRAFCALVLANRGDVQCAGAVARLAGDPSATVRSCAMGSLGHMAVRASPAPLPDADAAARAVRSCLGDGSVEVRRSALHAAACLGIALTASERGALAAAGDAEIGRLLPLLPPPGPQAGGGKI